MLPRGEVLALEELQKRLRTRTLGRATTPNELWDEISSTNTRAADLALSGAPEGVVVVARQQTAGRGRLGRSWVSPADAGIYLSVLLRPSELKSKDLAPITLAFGVAAARAIENAAGIRIGLKWVNDLVFEGRKLGGILAEMPSSSDWKSDNRALIAGFGINLRLDEADVPQDLSAKMTWLERIVGVPLDPNAVAAELLLQIETAYDMLKSNRSAEILNEWRSLSVTLGREVTASSGSCNITGVAVDIDNSGALLVKTEDGQTQQIHAGEVTVRTSDGKYI